MLSGTATMDFGGKRNVGVVVGIIDGCVYLGTSLEHAVLGKVEDVMTSAVLSRLYDAPIDVLRVRDRIVVVAAEGAVEIVPHRHDA